MVDLVLKRVVPGVGEGRFAFSILAPAGWMEPEVPVEEVDFSDAAAMKGLGVWVSEEAGVPLILTVSGRPGYEDGAVMQWALFLIERQGFAVKTCMPVRLKAHEGIEITCTQEADPGIGEMTIKGVFVEDGGNFFVVTTMAPTRLFGEWEAAFAEMRGSFALERAQGATKALVEGGAVPARVVADEATN